MREGWTYVSFGDIMTPAKVERCGKRIDLPILSITMRSGIILQNDRFKKKIASFDTKDYKIVKNGQLVIAFPIDEGLIYTQDIADQGIMSPAYSIWDVDYSNHNRRFLSYLFHSPFAMNYYKSKLRGTTQRRRMLPKEDLLSFPIPVPPLSEQQRIVSELDLLSSIIEKKKAQLKEYDQLAQSIFYDMFGDPVTNEKGWEVKEIESIGECISGGTPSRNNPQFFTGDINWFSAGELNKLFLDDSIEKITKEALESSSAKLCKPMSLFIGMYDTAAFKLGIATKASASNQACANVSLFNDNVVWFYYTLFLMREEALKHRHGARQKNLNLGYIKGFKVPLPPLPLQQSFASKIEAIERQKALIQQSIAEVQMLFDSRMDDWFA